MTEQHHQPSLRDLVEHAAEKRDLTGRGLAELAQKQGYDLTHTTVNKIRAQTYKSQPSDDTLRAIAWLAGVDEKLAFAAADRRVPLTPFADDLPPGVDYLEPKEREAVSELLRILVAQRREIDALRGKLDPLPAQKSGLSLVGSDDDGLFDPETLAARGGVPQEHLESDNDDM